MAQSTSFQRRLAAAAKGGVAAAHKCRLLAAKFGGIHVFVEGGDDRPFYEPFVVAAFGARDVWFHVADGRAEVLLARSLLPANFSLARKILFIIDRDFDTVLPAPPQIPNNVFATCFYSVESYYLSEDSLRALFVTHGNIEWASPFGDELRVGFQTLQTQAASQLRVAMAIAIVARARGATANLNNVRFSTLFTVGQDGSLRAKRHFLRTFVRQANINLSSIALADIRVVVTNLRLLDPRLWIRGKYFLALFVEFVRARFRKALEEKRARNHEFRHARTRVNIAADELMAICSGHLQCPAAFASYMASL